MRGKEEHKEQERDGGGGGRGGVDVGGETADQMQTVRGTHFLFDFHRQTTVNQGFYRRSRKHFRPTCLTTIVYRPVCMFTHIHAYLL